MLIDFKDELAEWLVELEEDGEPTSGTAKNVEEVYAREKYYDIAITCAVKCRARRERQPGQQNRFKLDDYQLSICFISQIINYCSSTNILVNYILK